MKRPALVLVSAGLAMMWPADVPRAATSSVPGSAHQGAAVSDHARANANTAVADLDERVARAMRTFEVPGLALAIVKDGRVVVAKGYGIRKLGEGGARRRPDAVRHRLEHEGVHRDRARHAGRAGKDPVGRPGDRLLPWFQLSDPYVTRELTVRDLLVHRSGLGLGAGDLLWWPASTYERREIARRLRYLPIATSFRSAYAYDNVLYLVAGEIIEAVSGQSWEDFMSSQILAKVGMRSSNVRHSDAARGGNVAATHARVDGGVRPIAPFDGDNTDPHAAGQRDERARVGGGA